jgi:glycosyltransferase involved in cell wall biosynthesis
MPKVLFVVSAAVSQASPILDGPRKDYTVLAQALRADVIDHSQVATSRTARLIEWSLGTPVALAWLAFRRHRAYDAILTDGEHVGIPLALMLKGMRAKIHHVTIGHRISASKKRPFFRWLRVHTCMARIAVHSRCQLNLASKDLGIPAGQVAFVPYQVDTVFWRPCGGAEERLIVSVGLEFRDYPTLFDAVDGIDARVVIGAASYWSRRANTVGQRPLPSNVKVGSFDYRALRELYGRAAIVVVPLDDVDFQAGVTTLLEAMAMEKAIIVTHSHGQTDVVEDRRTVTRGVEPRARPSSLLRTYAERADVRLAPNGFYVPPGDSIALRQAIIYLLDRPDIRRNLGLAGRHAVEQLMTVDHYAERLGELVFQPFAESTRISALSQPS